MAEVILLKNIPETSWKNGGGKTQELIRVPHPHTSDEFIFRLSIAQVNASGDFSLFPNIDRTLMLLRGSGLLLRMNPGQILLNQPLSPIHFKGEEVIRAEILSGSIQDFNVMTHRNWGRSEVVIKDLSTNEKMSVGGEKWTYLFLENGEISLEEQTVLPDSLVVLKPQEKIQIQALTEVTFIEIIWQLYDKPIHSP